jgi:hypothetical protein
MHGLGSSHLSRPVIAVGPKAVAADRSHRTLSPAFLDVPR